MEDLIKYAQNVLDAINEEYTGKSQQEEIIRDMYTVTERILETAKKNHVFEENINIYNYSRRFLDITSDYGSPILLEFEELVNQLKKLQENIK
ncbi:hypothetical protein LQI60_003189 [Listeria monocytogenes]|nr:hypothetical protein [Listeria monocytogenes]